jgi:hypothetical protein
LLHSKKFLNKKIAIIEKGTVYPHNCISFWSESLPFPAMNCFHSWNTVAVHFPNQPLQVKKLDNYRMYSFFSDEYISEIQKRLKNDRRITWLQETVTKVYEDGEKVVLKTLSGKILTAFFVFDSSNLGLTIKKSVPYYGSMWEIQTTRKHFDKTTCTLFDFEQTKKGNAFLYLLPMSSTRCLCGCVSLGRGVSLKEQNKWIKNYLSGSSWNIISRQKQWKPWVSLAKANTATRIIYIGNKAGNLNPATAYAFPAILKQSTKIAEMLCNNEEHRSFLPLTPKIYAILDNMSIFALKVFPELVVTFLGRLFNVNSADTIFDYLDRKLTLRQITLLMKRE